MLGGQGDQQIVVKSGQKRPKLENMTLSQWSVANRAILYQLVRENKLQGPSLFDYLSYTTKVYQLVQRYNLISVLLYDREYRKLQAALKFRWGTDVQHLSSIHLQARDKPAAQSNQQKKQTVPNKLGRSSKTRIPRRAVSHLPPPPCSRPSGRAVNDYCTSDWHQEFSKVDDAASMMTNNCYFAKVDLHSAYRSVRINAASQKSTGFKWNFDNREIYLKDTKLPFGANLSP